MIDIPQWAVTKAGQFFTHTAIRAGLACEFAAVRAEAIADMREAAALECERAGTEDGGYAEGAMAGSCARRIRALAAPERKEADRG